MKFFSRVNTRLWLTYVLLIAFVLFAALASIIFAFRNSPLLYWKEFVRLNYVTNSLSNRLDFFLDAKWRGIIDVFLVEADLLDVRVLITNENGSIILDSSRAQGSVLPEINDPKTAFERTEGSIRIFRDDLRKYWFYQINPINEEYYLIAAIPRPPMRISAIFQDELLNPLFRAGVIALVIAFFISWFVAQWITLPLKSISKSARLLATGDFSPISLKGPLEVQNLAEVINEMDRKVQNSIQSQKDFVANVSHEFKTPLTSIQGFAQAIADGMMAANDKEIQAAQVIIDETHRLNYLVNDLLMLSKFDAGTMNLKMNQTNVTQLLKNVIEKFRYRFEEKSINVVARLEEDLTISTDGERIVQVFNNLIDNAVKFTPHEGRIEISAGEDGNSAVISIRDSGIGIPEDKTDKIFDRFFQVEKSRDGRIEKGVGLGLSIANQIVIAHGGEIKVSSELGKGSCFMVKLPLSYEGKKQKT